MGDVDIDGTEDLGLRARKKLATRQALSCAAARLALERGLDNVRVDDIAAAAGVSPRTYNNYFSCREEAICAVQAERAHQIGAALRARPAQEPLAEAITNAVIGVYAGRGDPDRAMIRLVTSSPVLRGEFLKTITAIEWSLTEAITERTGADRDLFARVLAAAVAGTIRASIEHWLGRDDGTTLVTVLRDTLRLITPMASTSDRRTT